MMKWFGQRHNDPMYDDCEQCPAPAGEPCVHCDEAIVEGDDGILTNVALHRACYFRMCLGSAAHLLHMCSCYVANSEFMHDPPGMTRRQAAELVLQIVAGRTN